MNLRFDSLEVYNFKCFYGRHYLKFDNPGLYYVMGSNLVEPELGANGSGKSSFFTDSLYWCWTGKTIGDNRPGESVEPWDSSDATWVCNKFIWNNNTYHLVRGRNPNFLKLNDEVIDQSVLHQYLGMSENNLRRTLIIGQKGDLFLDLRPEEQSRMFTEMLDLDIWLSAAELASKKASAADRLAQDQDRFATEAKGRLKAFEEQLEQSKKANDDFELHKIEKIYSARRQVEIKEDQLEDHKEAKPEQVRSSKVKSLSEELEDLRKKLEKILKKEQELSIKVAEFNVKISENQGVVRQYESLQNNICPECGQEVSEEHLREKIRAYESEIKRLAKARAPLIEVRGGIQDSGDRLRSCIELKESDLRKERIRVDEDRQALEYWESVLIRFEDQLARDKKDLTTAENLQNPHKKSIDQLNSSIDKVKEQKEIHVKQRDRYQWEADTYRYWMQAYREIRLKLIDEVLLEIEVATNRHAEALGLIDWKIKFATERTTKSNTISRGWSTFIYPPGLDEPIRWESYSGGEEQRWRLANTFANSEVLLARAGLETNLEILDEPTIHLSESGITDLLSCLHDRALDLNRCIYFIDHHSLDKGNFDGTILVERTSSGSSLRYL